jgi:phytoene dehydrogenase-like protein
MYGDTTVIRALARRMREQGGEIRAEADSLVGRIDAVRWTGLAADAMRGLGRDHAADLRLCATLHADAADALDRHAREVDRLEELIASIEHRALSALGSARHVLGGVAHALSDVVPDPLEHGAHHFVPPPHGSKEWLSVHLPRVW